MAGARLLPAGSFLLTSTLPRIRIPSKSPLRRAIPTEGAGTADSLRRPGLTTGRKRRTHIESQKGRRRLVVRKRPCHGDWLSRREITLARQYWLLFSSALLLMMYSAYAPPQLCERARGTSLPTASKAASILRLSIHREICRPPWVEGTQTSKTQCYWDDGKTYPDIRIQLTRQVAAVPRHSSVSDRHGGLQ